MNIPKKAPSRVNKKQLAAHIDPTLVERMKAYCHKFQLTQTEIIAMAVNEAVSSYGMGPLLQVSRERFVKRVKSPSQVQTKGPICRTGTKRIAAFFDLNDVDRVKSFSKENGISQEALITDGLERLLKGPPAKKAA